MDRHWTQVTPSEFPWERDALAFLKQHLPDHEPYRVWANFEFLLDGKIVEVDALVIAPKGVFLVEIKSWPGRLDGDAGTWRNTRPGDVRARSMDNGKRTLLRQRSTRRWLMTAFDFKNLIKVSSSWPRSVASSTRT